MIRGGGGVYGRFYHSPGVKNTYSRHEGHPQCGVVLESSGGPRDELVGGSAIHPTPPHVSNPTLSTTLFFQTELMWVNTMISHLQGYWERKTGDGFFYLSIE